MAKSRKVPRRPGTPQPRKRSIRSGGITSWYLWVIVAVLVLAALFMLARTLSIAPPREVILPILASTEREIGTLTRMAGDIELDSGLTGGLSDELRKKLKPVDSLLVTGIWDEALKQLGKVSHSVNGRAAAVIAEYEGLSYYRLSRPDNALHSFRRAAATDSDRDPARQSRLAFAIGYLFQLHGFADSALVAYSTAHEFATDDRPYPLLPAINNNLALAYETIGDTTRALEFYLAAVSAIDTTADTPTARIIRDNLNRINRPQVHLPDMISE